MNKFNIDEVVNVSFEGSVRGQVVIVSEAMTVYGVVKNIEPGANYDTISTYKYLVKKNPNHNGEWVLENKISKPGTAK